MPFGNKTFLNFSALSFLGGMPSVADMAAAVPAASPWHITVPMILAVPIAYLYRHQ